MRPGRPIHINGTIPAANVPSTTFNGLHASGSTTLTVPATAGFAATGILMLERGTPLQETVTYTSTTGTTFVLDPTTPTTVAHANLAAIVSEARQNHIIEIPKRNGARVRNQNLAGPNWNGAPMNTGRTWNDNQGGKTSRFTIRNVAGDDLEVSFDNGKNFFILPAGSSFDGEISIRYFVLRNGNPSTTGNLFEALAILTP